MTVPVRSLYLATNVFAKGGIERYSRAQIRAIRAILGKDGIITFSLHPPDENQFEEPFVVDYVGNGLSVVSRADFIGRVALQTIRLKPNLIWVNHITLLPLANLLCRFSQNCCTVVNVYGLEVWSGLSHFEIHSLKSVTHVVADCHATAAFMQQELNVAAGRISVIWDPVDTNRFRPSNSADRILTRYGIPYSPQTCYIMTLGRISKGDRYKGYDRIIDAMKVLTEQDIAYLIAGDGNDRARLEQRVTSEGLQDRVFFLGSIPEEDLVDVYNACDFFALISDRGPGRGEGIPLTPLEAAACAKPIIVGDEDGSREAVEEGVNGLIVSPHDPSQICQAILRLVRDPISRRKMGQAGRQWIVDNFSYQVFEARTAQVIENLSQ